MKIIYLILSLIFTLIAVAIAQTNVYEQASSLWFSGNSQGVLDIANQRLARNTNDLAGLLLKFQWYGEHLQFDHMTQTMSQVLAVGAMYSGTNFAKEYPVLQTAYETLKYIITNYPPEEYAADLTKTNIPGRTMSCDAALKALQDDGYFQ